MLSVTPSMIICIDLKSDRSRVCLNNTGLPPHPPRGAFKYTVNQQVPLGGFRGDFPEKAFGDSLY
jgi:hypothetical protein